MTTLKYMSIFANAIFNIKIKPFEWIQQFGND